MDQLKSRWRHRLILLLIYASGLGSLLGHWLWHTDTQASIPRAGCQSVGQTSRLEIAEDQLQPQSLELRVCDRLVIRNHGHHAHLMAFGKHDQHLKYPGYQETLLNPNDGVELTLYQAGNFELHDHLNESLQAQLNVR